MSNHALLAKKIGLKTIRILGQLVAALSVIPVILLPFITAVPYWLVILLFIADAALLYLLFSRTESWSAFAILLPAVVLISILAVLASQWFAATPPITGPDGNVMPGSIATLERVNLNGSRQWISIRGQSQEKPVLLFLAGGPGGTQLAATRKVLGKLEEDFVVVNWEQPGAGKSFGSVPIDELTPDRYVADAQALTRYLLERFQQEKIYLVGESWGSILGTWMVQKNPDMYHALVGVAQMAAFLETDLYDYELAMRLCQEKGDNRTYKALQKQGPPPYYGKGTAWKVTRYIMVLSQHMMQNPGIGGPGYDTFGDIFADEYGLYDKVNYFRGLLRVMDTMWPQLWDVDLRQDAPVLAVPVYFVAGRHDVNAPPHLAQDYFEIVQAPYKELIWFENSGHSPWIDESDKMIEILVNLQQMQNHGIQ